MGGISTDGDGVGFDVGSKFDVSEIPSVGFKFDVVRISMGGISTDGDGVGFNAGAGSGAINGDG